MTVQQASNFVQDESFPREVDPLLTGAGSLLESADLVSPMTPQAQATVAPGFKLPPYLPARGPVGFQALLSLDGLVENAHQFRHPSRLDLSDVDGLVFLETDGPREERGNDNRDEHVGDQRVNAT